MAENIVDETLTFIKDTLRKMDREQHNHFKAVCGALLSCYTDPKLHGMVLIGLDDEDRPDAVELAHIVSVNTTDIIAAQLMVAGQNKVGTLVMADAPPRELFN